MVENAAGVPYPGALLNFYLTGSSHRTPTYTDPGLTTPNSNPVEADAGGTFPLIYLNPAVNYKVVLTDALGNEIWTADPVLQAWSGRLDIITPSGGDDTAIIAAASALGPIVLAGGNFIISGVLTCPGYVEMLSNAVLTTPSAASVAFNGGFSAPIGLAFGPNVTVTFNPQFFSTGYPEWWGAVTNNPAIDCAPALTACVAACPTTLLQLAHYYTATLWTMDTNNRTVIGQSVDVNSVIAPFTYSNATIIISNSATDDICIIGTYTQPVGGINKFLQGFDIRNVSFARATAPTPPTSGMFYGAPGSAGGAGVRIQYVLSCQFTKLQSAESFYAYYLSGVVGCHFDDCGAARLSAGSTPTNDGFFGWFLDASASIGTVDGIASGYIRRCGASQSEALSSFTYSYGLYTYEGFTDIYISQFETGGVYNGIICNQAPASVSQDLMIMDCVLDSCKTIGIGIFGNSVNIGAFTIRGCYVANTTASSTGSLIYISGMPGHGIIADCQLVGGAATPCFGIQYVGPAALIDVTDCLMTNVKRPFFASAAFGGYVRFNAVANFVTGFDAALLSDCSRMVIEPGVSGVANAYVNGINMSGASNSYITARVSGLNPGALSGTRLISNGSTISTGGTFSTTSWAEGNFN